jgi:hypothetical protein
VDADEEPEPDDPELGAAPEPELDEPALGAELLLPHAAMTSVADTASAAVAHALCFTLPPLGRRPRAASLNPSWVVPQAMPGRAAWEGDTHVSSLLVAESEPGNDRTPGMADRRKGVWDRSLGDSYSGRYSDPAAALADRLESPISPFAEAGTPG